ncbi:MAG: hypothetical protein HY898_35225 [Deltaproteobacteria bacterium]|nr:hypothetical protein [Deltaproteobacteria bacterium]
MNTELGTATKKPVLVGRRVPRAGGDASTDSGPLAAAGQDFLGAEDVISEVVAVRHDGILPPACSVGSRKAKGALRARRSLVDLRDRTHFDGVKSLLGELGGIPPLAIPPHRVDELRDAVRGLERLARGGDRLFVALRGHLIANARKLLARVATDRAILVALHRRGLSGAPLWHR